MANEWITGCAFLPTVGSEYEVAFGQVTHQGQTGMWIARIRAEGMQPSLWIDLDTGMQLDDALAANVVQAYRELNSI